jgi:uncharacterized coiled-coil protein SlyX
MTENYERLAMLNAKLERQQEILESITLALSYHAKAVEQAQILLMKLTDRLSSLEDYTRGVRNQ